MDLMTLALAKHSSGGSDNLYKVKFTGMYNASTDQWTLINSDKSPSEIITAHNEGKFVYAILSDDDSEESLVFVLKEAYIDDDPDPLSNQSKIYFECITTYADDNYIAAAFIHEIIGVLTGGTSGTYHWDYGRRKLGLAAITATVTIAVADWNGGTTCTKNVSSVTASNVVFCDSSDSSVQCTAQGEGTLTFTATSTPTAPVTVKVVILP